MALPVLLPDTPAPDAEWLRLFTRHLQSRRSTLSRFSARQLALQAFEAMFLLPPEEASELWDERMCARVPGWRRMR